MARPSRHCYTGFGEYGAYVSGGAERVAADRDCDGVIRQLWIRVGGRFEGVGFACDGCGRAALTKETMRGEQPAWT